MGGVKQLARGTMSDTTHEPETSAALAVWDACVEDELNDMGERVSAHVMRRVMERIRRTGVVGSLPLPYRRDLVTNVAYDEGKEALRDVRRRVVRDCSGFATPEWTGAVMRGLQGENLTKTPVSRSIGVCLLALAVDAVACYLLLGPGESFIEVCRSVVEMLATSKLVGSPEIPAEPSRFLPDFSSMSALREMLQVGKLLVQLLFGLIAFIKIWVLLWVVSLLHKRMVRRDLRRQIRQAVDRMMDEARRQFDRARESLR